MEIRNSGRSLEPKKYNIFDIDFLRFFEGVPSHSLFPEFVAVSRGIKPVLRTYAIRLDRFNLFKKVCQSYSLFVERSDFRISSEDDTRISPSGPFIYTYISKSKKSAREAKQIEYDIFLKKEISYKKPLRFARLMGYPKCCFDSWWELRGVHSPAETGQVEYRASKRTEGEFSFYLNNLIRGDYYLIAHHPCSYQCQPSIKYAKKVLGAIKAVDPLVAKKIVTLLKFPVIKFLKRGRYLRLIDGHLINGQSVIYRTCEGDESFIQKFIKGNKLQIEKDRIKIFRDNLLVGIYHKRNEFDGVIFPFT